jgi:hypothetical protein
MPIVVAIPSSESRRDMLQHDHPSLADAQCYLIPSSTETSPAMMKALREHGMLATLMSPLFTPTAHGAEILTKCDRVNDLGMAFQPHLLVASTTK